ncbi:MAG: elongation factor G, partial [Acidimicrobiales bacterium]
MQLFSSEKIRNVALVGHGGAGKTTLAEALLHRAGAITRLGRVEDGSTVCDHDPEEQRRGLSLALAIAPFEWKGHKVNLIDTPGYADFMGDVAAALRVADLAVFVVSAVDGVEVQTEAVWRMAARLGVPRMIFVNKLDRERASFERTLDELRDRLGAGVAPLELPIGAEASFRGIADLLTDTAHVYVDGVPHTEAIPDDMEALEHQVHDNLVEGIVVAEDALLERYLEGDIPSVSELERALTLGIEMASVFPVVCGSATSEVGIDRLADFLVEIGPPPTDRATLVTAGDAEVDVPADPAGEALAFVFKTIADPFVGQLSLFKVLSGTIRNDDHLVNSRTGTDERLHGLFVVRGREHEAVDALTAGDLGGVAKLAGTATGDTLAARGKPVVVPAIDLPPAVLALAVVPKTQADDDKLTSAIHRLQEEDPALLIERDEETHQTILRGTGETHLAIALEKLERKFGVGVTTEPVRVRYRETITETTQAEGRHKKQSGGHGQFAVVTIRVEPLERGAGFEFVDKIVGGAISRSYIPAVQRGVEETMASGGVNGHPVVDVRVTVLDGKEHSVDSSEMAFRIAGRLAFRAAMAKAGPVVLEPIVRLDVTVPAELLGDVMGDLNARRGRVQGTEPGEVGEQVIYAVVPQSELLRYAVELRSLT